MACAACDAAVVLDTMALNWRDLQLDEAVALAFLAGTVDGPDPSPLCAKHERLQDAISGCGRFDPRDTDQQHGGCV